LTVRVRYAAPSVSLSSQQTMCLSLKEVSGYRVPQGWSLDPGPPKVRYILTAPLGSDN